MADGVTHRNEYSPPEMCTACVFSVCLKMRRSVVMCGFEGSFCVLPVCDDMQTPL